MSVPDNMRFMLRFLPLLIFSAWPTAASPEPADQGMPGFALRPFKTGVPDETMTYESAEARALAREIFAVGQATRVTVREQTLIPVGRYSGLAVDISLPVRVQRETICEERHAVITLTPETSIDYGQELRLTIRDGSLTGHRFDELWWRGLYRRLPEKPSSAAAATEACRRLAADTSGWRQAANESEFVYEEWRQKSLIEAVNAPNPAPITCIGIDDQPCSFDREKLLAIFRNTPPDYSQQMFVPDEGWLYVFRYREPNDDIGTDYTVTMPMDAQDKPRSIRVRFSREPRPRA